MKKQILIGIIGLLIIIVLGVVIFVKPNNKTESKTESKAESKTNIAELTKDYKLTNYKITNVNIRNVNKKTNITFNITNTSDKTLSNEIIYINFKKKNKVVYVLQGNLGENFAPKEVRSLETSAIEDLLSKNVDEITYEIK